MKIVCIGSGNVATHMAIAFKEVGAEIIQVWSPNAQHAEILAALTQAEAIHNWADLDRTADCYVIAVRDDAIAAVAPHLADLKGIVVHTSGATAIDVLSATGKGYGVLYPLQTFSKTTAIDLKKVPLCIEADSAETLDKLSAIAHLISPMVSVVSTEQRSILHVAAVFACNFSNHLYHLSNTILAQYQLDFALLKPLIMETAQKIQTSDPRAVQTGPAVRGDEKTMAKHLSLLTGSPELQVIYEILSKSIKNTYN